MGVPSLNDVAVDGKLNVKPIFPSMYNDKPAVMKGVTNSEIVSEHIIAKSQSFSMIIKKIVYLRRFPFQVVITDSSGDKCRINHHNKYPFVRYQSMSISVTH